MIGGMNFSFTIPAGYYGISGSSNPKEDEAFGKEMSSKQLCRFFAGMLRMTC
tara:strand:- start:202 stop:357 length:156 start_codon:yes stop_codon:yes gene_type:complete